MSALSTPKEKTLEMASSKENTSDGQWHLDKRVPLALIITLLLQFAVAVWWGSGVSERVNALERQQIMSAPQADRLTRVETKIEAIQDGISEIKRLIRRDPS